MNFINDALVNDEATQKKKKCKILYYQASDVEVCPVIP